MSRTRPIRLSAQSLCVIATLTTLQLALEIAPARAQGKAGAERYEVTITPPKRPGSEEAVVEAVPPIPTATAPGDDVLGERPPVAASANAAVAVPTPNSATTEQPASPVAAKKTIAPNLPMRSLQIGAFRQRSSADALHQELRATFPDVIVVEVESGGSPLYRVFVGRMPHGPELDAVRRRLVAASQPAFEVAAPVGTAGE